MYVRIFLSICQDPNMQHSAVKVIRRQRRIQVIRLTRWSRRNWDCERSDSLRSVELRRTPWNSVELRRSASADHADIEGELQNSKIRALRILENPWEASNIPVKRCEDVWFHEMWKCQKVWARVDEIRQEIAANAMWVVSGAASWRAKRFQSIPSSFIVDRLQTRQTHDRLILDISGHFWTRIVTTDDLWNLVTWPSWLRGAKINTRTSSRLGRALLCSFASALASACSSLFVLFSVYCMFSKCFLYVSSFLGEWIFQVSRSITVTCVPFRELSQLFQP